MVVCFFQNDDDNDIKPMRKNCRATLTFMWAKCGHEPDFKTKNERVKKEVGGRTGNA